MLLHPPDELSHVVPGAHPQQSGELAVNRVLHDYVHHLAPGVHDGVELPLHLLRSVNTGHGALHVSGRTVGSTLDILGTAKELDEDALVTDFVNLYATTPSGQQIKSSTFHLIGEGYNLALGINFDYSSLVYANRILVDLMSAEADLQSALWHGGDSRLADVFDECLAAVGKPVSALNKRDRMKIIALLDQKNAFSFRKSVPFVAKRLQVSRYTVYKYLGELTGAHAEESEEE